MSNIDDGTGFFKDFVEFISLEKNAIELQKKVHDLSPQWINEPKLICGSYFDDRGEEVNFTLEYLFDPKVRYVSASQVQGLFKDTECHFKRMSRTSVAPS